MAGSFYLEWDSPLSGRFLIQSTEYQLEVSEPAWRFSAEELMKREQTVAEESSDAFAIEIRDDGTEGEWNEFRCEELLRESDARGEKYRRLLEKYLNHPDRERIVAHEMGWTWLDEALDEKADHPNEDVDAGDSLSLEEELPPPDPSREGIDWVRDEDGEIAHPIKKRATDMLYSLLDELRAAGNPERHHVGLGDFVSYTMILSAKLAGALGGLARGWGLDSGLTIASLKRALEFLHQALSAAASLGPDTPFSLERIAPYRDELFLIREQVIALMNKLREC